MRPEVYYNVAMILPKNRVDCTKTVECGYNMDNIINSFKLSYYNEYKSYLRYETIKLREPERYG